MALQIECNHGCPPPTDEACVQFVEALYEKMRAHRGDVLTVAIQKAVVHAVSRSPSPQICFCDANIEWVKARLVADAADILLRRVARDVGVCVEHCLLILLLDDVDGLRKVMGIPTSGTGCEREVSERRLMRNHSIISGCPRTLAEFFKKRIQCDCLDGICAAMKSQRPKISRCGNCMKTKEKKALMVCTGCQREEYCSRACQVAHWTEHKARCREHRKK